MLTVFGLQSITREAPLIETGQADSVFQTVLCVGGFITFLKLELVEGHLAAVVTFHSEEFCFLNCPHSSM